MGRGLGGFEAYSSELPPMQNCELLPSHFDEFASEGRGGASCKWNWAHLGQSLERIFNAQTFIPHYLAPKSTKLIHIISQLSLFAPCIAPSIYSLFTLAASLSDLNQLPVPRAERIEWHCDRPQPPTQTNISLVASHFTCDRSLSHFFSFDGWWSV